MKNKNGNVCIDFVRNVLVKTSYQLLKSKLKNVHESFMKREKQCALKQIKNVHGKRTSLMKNRIRSNATEKENIY